MSEASHFPIVQVRPCQQTSKERKEKKKKRDKEMVTSVDDNNNKRYPNLCRNKRNIINKSYHTQRHGTYSKAYTIGKAFTQGA